MWKSSDPSCRARRAENERLLEVLPRALVELESRYAQLRWHGYQFMSPLECTRQFAVDYRAQFGRTFYGACYFEPEVGSEEFEILWQMRLDAEDCFMSYPMYLAIAFGMVRGRNPELYRRPHTRFSHFQTLRTWRKKATKVYGEMRWRERNRIAAMGHFQRKSFRGLPAQEKFRSMIKNIAERDGYGRATQMYVLQHPVLPPAELLSGLSATKRVEAIAEMKAAGQTFIQITEEVVPEVASQDLLQTCFAWPRSKSWEERCKTCPQEMACGASPMG
jgi:hypothetical protein